MNQRFAPHPLTRFTRQVIPARLVNNESGIAIMSALMLMLIVTALSVLVLGFVLAEVRPTQFANKNTRTIAAAQAGIEVAVAQIRTSTAADGTGVQMGNILELPCEVRGPVEGAADGTGFEAKISYFTQDPAGRDATWRQDNALRCFTTGSPKGVRAVPRFAIITSEGTDPSTKVIVDAADRTVEATYTFPLTTRNVSGGQITDDSGNYCLVANSLSAGSGVTFLSGASAACREKTDYNLWSWRSDYMIHLSSSDTNGRVPMCLSGRATSGTPAAMVLRACNTGAGDPQGQLFQWTGEHTWRGQNAANTDISNTRIKVATIGGVRTLGVVNANSGANPIPLPEVGKGNASKDTDQVVNQQKFGRCLDVTDENLSKAYMITYPCKQDPSGQGQFSWNHKWYYTEVDPDSTTQSVSTKIYVRHGNTTQNCLITTNTQGVNMSSSLNRTSGSLTMDGVSTSRFPIFRTSSNGIDCSSANSNWTRNGDTGVKETSWTFVDRNGRCLSANGPKMHVGWDAVVVETCNGSNNQKWNVPEDPVEGTLTGFEELTGRTE
jgi:hypothetical protein